MVIETQPEAITRLCPAGQIRGSCPPHTRAGTQAVIAIFWKEVPSRAWEPRSASLRCLPIFLSQTPLLRLSDQGSWLRCFSLLWLSTFPFGPFLPPLSSCPGPWVLEHPRAFFHCSAAMRCIPTSALATSAPCWVHFPGQNGIGRPHLCCVLLYYSKYIKAQLLLSFCSLS